MVVSVIIPSYNSEKYIGTTIQSVLSQEGVDMEVIVVDDGSSDNSEQVIRQFPVELIRQCNKGACSARNVGFEESKGELIQFMDADDVLAPNKILNQIKFFSAFGKRIVVSGPWARFYHDPSEASFSDKFLDRDWDNPLDWLVYAWEGKGMAQTAVWLTPRSIVEKAGPWNEKLEINQDGEFFSRVLLQARGIKFCKEARVYYRTGISDSITNTINRQKVESLLLSYRLYQVHILKMEDTYRVRHALMRNYLSFIYSYYSMYPDLVAEAKKEIKGLGFKKLPPYGGSGFQKVAGILGFENTLRMRRFFKGY